MDEKQEKVDEMAVEREGRRGRLEVPPVIIKGGSIEVEFKNEPFEDDDNHTKVKKVKYPKKDTKITVIEVRDYQKNILNTYRLPASYDGKCLIYVWDDEP